MTDNERLLKFRAFITETKQLYNETTGSHLQLPNYSTANSLVWEMVMRSYVESRFYGISM